MTPARPVPGLIDWRRQRGRIAALVALMAVSALTEGAGLLLLVPMLAVLGAGGTAAATGGGRIEHLIGMLGIPLRLDALLALYVALVAVRAAVNALRLVAALGFEIAVVDALRARALDALMHCDWRVLGAMRQSDNASMLIGNIDRIGFALGQGVAALGAAITLAGLGIAALALAPALALGALCAGGLVLPGWRAARRRSQRLGEGIAGAYTDIFARVTESLGALRTIKSLGGEERAASEAAAGFAALGRARIAFAREIGIGQITLQLGGAAVLAALVMLAVGRLGIGIAAILPLAALFARALGLLEALQGAWQNWAQARGAVRAALDLIARAEAAREPADRGLSAPALVSAMRLDRVGVRFAGAERGALDDISLVLPAGSITAITGASGAGQSTLADLLGGLIAPDRGTVGVDGVVLDDGLRRAWRRRVAYVQQEGALLAATIRENLLWGAPGASEAQLEAALAAASAGFVKALAGGIDTRIGDGGRTLSGGERQRLMLARALVRSPALLILDEATSALDGESEGEVARAIARLRGRVTVVIIGHRGALLDVADQTIRLAHGRLAKGESGV